MTNTIFKLDRIMKEYKSGDVSVLALKNTSFEIKKGELVVVLGPSGSGKSTLLNIIGGMDLPTEGHVVFDGEDISTYDNKKLTLFRRNKIGFIFQFYNLMPNLTAKENVEISTEISKNSLSTDEVLEKVGLKDRSNHFPAQMSGGEQQRVAIARAIAKNPDVLLCDEPTGALDYSTGIKVLALLKEINKTMGKTVIIITHNQPIAQMADKVVKMRSGEIASIYENKNPVDPETIEW
ncbi:MAG TPA: ABC transporter ATP-binding protein [Pseudobacteroides sp.]|uniref:ABC transporter ATP-binding protein n=1 Tax=Pseudobacteroides sp. TaxID=1968840 RepID=UPI002F94713F